MTALFWIFFALILTNYLLFPLLVIALSRFRRREIAKAPIRPTLTLVISAYNEEAVIAEKLRNCRALEYPEGRLEVIVVSDGSTDATAAIARRFELNFPNSNVRSLFEPARKGKASAMNRGVAAAGGEIVVFSDANTMYHPDALLHLVENFNDESVGGVCGRKSIKKETGRASSLGDRLFWKFEAALKRGESLLGSIPTADGEIFAVRKTLYRSLPEGTINDDTAITLDIVGAGLRVVYDPLAVSEESASLTLTDDMAVKARMVCGGYQSLVRYRSRLLPPKDFFGFQYFCHKTLRHGMPFLLLGLFVTNLALSGGAYGLFLAAQIAFYGSAAAGALSLASGRKVKALYLPLYYCSMNLSAVSGFVHFVRGRSLQEIWTKAER